MYNQAFIIIWPKYYDFIKNLIYELNNYEFKIIEKQDYFEEKILKRKIMLYSGQTFYTNWGNFPLIFLILLYFSYTLVEYYSFKKKI